ncbi:hypothetical protein POVWA2_081970 [Plasmodium ovale wallikeri]|uniref:Uncharacterized protein n=1 Tax=Plasmodium ovale wallikeri TaxID=864142 RepID=A0A1A9AP28_PLAOA|nr:hypothetical protein POVWA2_081970 [Plasmodium ovale wallikeri]
MTHLRKGRQKGALATNPQLLRKGKRGNFNRNKKKKKKKKKYMHIPLHAPGVSSHTSSFTVRTYICTYNNTLPSPFLQTLQDD